MSNFAFLQHEWPPVFEAAAKAEAAAHNDPRTSCFYARRALELAVWWAFKHDATLQLPYQDNLSALVHEPSFKQAAGQPVFNKAKVLISLGNRAVHEHRAIPQNDAMVALRELFHVCYWLARTYSRDNPPPQGLAFDEALMPRPAADAKKTAEQLRGLLAALHERDEKLKELLADRSRLDEELERARAEVTAAKKAAATIPDDHDYSETETRDYFIDLLLKEAGWPLDQPRDREFEVAGMPNNAGNGFVDYVLWGDDGRPLGLVEAKRTRRSAQVGQQQAKLYADCLKAQFGQRPVIFYSNGYQHWIWDDASYGPRAIQGFLKKAELELLIQRRTSRRPLATAEINPAIVERYYQTRAIRRIAESFERDNERKALLVMATGAGKTRTVIALCDLLMRCNWAKRVLFLADRVALVKQAENAFKQHLPDSSPVNLVTDKHGEGRVFVSTYPTMMGLIDESQDGQRRFGVGHFDLVIIDEAHRSVFQKYRAIFDYFDSYLVGLTATPKDEVDRNTYSLFDLENGVPTDAYGIDEAVRDGYLVPPQAVSVPLRFQREGINYDELSEEEKDQWDALEWDEEGDVPDRVGAEAINSWLFNTDTVDKVLAHVMTNGIHVAGGDRLGKTILFAKNQAHAEFISQRFEANYPHYKGAFARIVTFKTEYAQSLIDDFSQKEKMPHLAISVDMLDTGIDVPEVVNLVFFKLVRSKTKFWQMVGRGTRLCPDLFGPGQDKECFYIFDYCQNLEYFSQDVPAAEGALPESLGKRLFNSRLELISLLDQRAQTGDPPAALAEGTAVYGDPETEEELRIVTADLLRNEVAAMNVDNFVVRPKRKAVEEYSKPEAWLELTPAKLAELSHDVAGLPTELEEDNEEAKRFDLLLLNLQLAVLRAEPGFARLREQVVKIAGLLEEQATIPMVKEHIVLITEIQTEEWWQDVTLPMLERVRRRLRGLVRLIDKQKRKPVYTDFEDLMGDASVFDLPGFTVGTNFEKFKEKARAFLRSHQDNLAINKLRMGKPLTRSDLDEIELMLMEARLGTDEDIEQAKETSHGLGLFVRSLVGLDRQAAQAAFSEFLQGALLTANQIEFVTMLIDHLEEFGVVETARLYESPFIDIASQGPDGLFRSDQVDELVAILEGLKATAEAA